MFYTQPNTFLRYALLADAIASGATGLLLIAGAGVLESLLNIPLALSREAGLVLIPYVAFVATVGTRETIARGAVWAVIAANAVWALASVALLVSGWIAPNLLGVVFIALQAAVVAVFGELQFVGLRRSALAA
ncbi:MAG: hypothetical protein V7604_2626 [Hyphomicrobiales bacterium]|jgi:hypothetical protein